MKWVFREGLIEASEKEGFRVFWNCIASLYLTLYSLALKELFLILQSNSTLPSNSSPIYYLPLHYSPIFYITKNYSTIHPSPNNYLPIYTDLSTESTTPNRSINLGSESSKEAYIFFTYCRGRGETTNPPSRTLHYTTYPRFLDTCLLTKASTKSSSRDMTTSLP